jgi:uncharacterized protein YfiM (DUF2279 family)
MLCDSSYLQRKSKHQTAAFRFAIHIALGFSTRIVRGVYAAAASEWAEVTRRCEGAAA